MEFIEATAAHFCDIVNLVSSPEELYIMSPLAQYPWSVNQISAVFETRTNHTICVIAGKIAAYANIYNIAHGQRAFIGNVIVSDQFKGRGIGKALILHMVKTCRRQHQAQAHLSVFATNTKALCMYKSLGFTPYKIELRQDLFGNSISLIHMQLKA